MTQADTAVEATSVAPDNEARVRAGYEAFGRGDLDAVGAQFAPNAVWHAQQLGVLGGDHEGWPSIVEFFGRSMEMTRGTFRVDLEDLMANERGAAAVVRSRGERDGMVLDSKQVHLFRMENGVIAEIWQFVDDGHAVDAFWSE